MGHHSTEKRKHEKDKKKKKAKKHKKETYGHKRNSERTGKHHKKDKEKHEDRNEEGIQLVKDGSKPRKTHKKTKKSKKHNNDPIHPTGQPHKEYRKKASPEEKEKEGAPRAPIAVPLGDAPSGVALPTPVPQPTAPLTAPTAPQDPPPARSAPAPPMNLPPSAQESSSNTSVGTSALSGTSTGTTGPPSTFATNFSSPKNHVSSNSSNSSNSSTSNSVSSTSNTASTTDNRATSPKKDGPLASSKSSNIADDLTVKCVVSPSPALAPIETPTRYFDKVKKFVNDCVENGIDAMAGEFKHIRSHLPVAATRIDFDHNPDKNRFEDIVCIDQTRVNLENAHGEEYIHANWLNVYNDNKAILTQLPMANTACDFWHMLLENNVKGVLLFLTKFEWSQFVQPGTFPDKNDFIHYANHLRVSEVKRIEFSDTWTLRVMSIKFQDKQSFVHLHHHSDWPHALQPNNMLEIWQIQSLFRRYDSPHVIMSLSGAGRAGTYAAFELAHYRLHSDNFTKISVYDAVIRTRDSRMHAVQTPAQHAFIYMALLEHILSNQVLAAIISVNKPETMDKYKKVQARYAEKYRPLCQLYQEY